MCWLPFEWFAKEVVLYFVYRFNKRLCLKELLEMWIIIIQVKCFSPLFLFFLSARREGLQNMGDEQSGDRLLGETQTWGTRKICITACWSTLSESVFTEVFWPDRVNGTWSTDAPPDLQRTPSFMTYYCICSQCIALYAASVFLYMEAFGLRFDCIHARLNSTFFFLFLLFDSLFFISSEF